jgi:hypothetical protein
MGGSVARIIGLGAAGAAILLLSFWFTLTLIDDTPSVDISLVDVPVTNADGTPRVSRASDIRGLPPVPSGSSFGTAWDGIEGISAMDMGPGPTGSGKGALSLVATRDAGRHRLGVQFVGLPADRPLRLTAWIKAPQGTRLGVEIRDGKGGPQSEGSAAVDLSRGVVVATSGPVRLSIETAPRDWVRVPIETRSADGVIVIYLALLGPGNAATFAGNGEQMILGGLELTAG